MAETNPYIEKFAGMNPMQLDRQLEVAKSLLPDSSIYLGVAFRTDLSPTEQADMIAGLVSRRMNSEGLQRGLMILGGLKPKMVATNYLKSSLDSHYQASFDVGITAEDREKHLVEVLFEARFPQGFDLRGALFVPERAGPVEAAIFRAKLKDDQLIRSGYELYTGAPQTQPDTIDKENSEWLAKIRELHGSDVI